MLVNAANLNALRTGFSGAFKGGLAEALSHWSPEVRSSQKRRKIWLVGKMPNVREWIGKRAVQSPEQHDYANKEKKLGLTIGVDRDDVEADNLGIAGPMFSEMGRSSGNYADTSIFALLKEG